MPSRRSLTLLFHVALSLFPASGQGSSAARHTRTPDDALAIGADCIDCHPGIVATYRETGMARAAGPLAPDELLALGEVSVPGTGFRYHFESTGARVEIVETWRPRDGAPGKPVRRSAEIGFAIGAGLLDRSYVAVDSERMWFAPLEVVTGPDGERHAALSPPHAMRPETRFTSPVENRCLACHTDHLPEERAPANLAPPLEGDGAFRPRGLSCAACHGNVARHVAEETGETTPAGGGAFVGLGDSDVVERMSVCARCHLQGDARFPLVRHAPPVPPPGGDVLEKLALFVARTPTSDVGFVSHTERLVLSRCYTETLGADRPLSCESCHDPHRTLFAAAERKVVRAACLQCHPATSADGPSRGVACAMPVRERAGQDCVRCHMRKTPVFDVDEVEIHDHFIRARPGDPSRFTRLRSEETRDGELRPFRWPGRPAPPFAEEPGLTMMAMVRIGNEAAARALVDDAPGALSRRLPAYHHIHGSLLERMGRLEEARLSYKRALILDREAPESAVNLALLLGRLGRPGEGLALLDEWIAKHPRLEAAWRNRAILQSMTGDEQAFERDLLRAQELLPNAATARALAELCERTGRIERAAAWRAEARRLDPEHAD